MKKSIITILAAAFACLSSYGQNLDSIKSLATSELSLKPGKRSVVTELNVNPLKGDLNLNNSVNQIKLRIFSSPQFAWRIGFDINRKDSVFNQSSPYGSNSSIYENNMQSAEISVNLGFERHLKGTRRLSPYYGLDLVLGHRSSKEELTQNQQTTTVEGAWTTRSVVWIPNYNGGGSYQYVSSTTGERAYFKFGLNAVAGFDFYLAKSFFIGYEFNFGFSQMNYKKVKITQTGGSSSTPDDNTDFKNTKFSLGSNLTNGIRIGYIF